MWYNHKDFSQWWIFPPYVALASISVKSIENMQYFYFSNRGSKLQLCLNFTPLLNCAWKSKWLHTPWEIICQNIKQKSWPRMAVNVCVCNISLFETESGIMSSKYTLECRGWIRVYSKRRRECRRRRRKREREERERGKDGGRGGTSKLRCTAHLVGESHMKGIILRHPKRRTRETDYSLLSRR